MSELKGAMIIGQSGGPTAVINASAYGAIRAGLDADCITKVYGASHGIVGVLNDELFVMDEEDPAELELAQVHPVLCPGQPAATRSPTRTRMTPITSASWRFSRSTTSAISSTTAATTPWTPATRSSKLHAEGGL